ncbi:PEGA domain-containing protein [Rubritalea squalenifaciens DSM 18772]|uniref:PEGA domain-containing protein n=1 Tax=Rubritalea squalenifaciens DSM 18772 TaxID=1123071 RepID=A0A1M6I2N6_9BACT|nr:SUMF1/EgtB/PvdO family nonheme iron enzyme [Rubritalea squalenifaciens]SHJ28731.1 PEGA domain-containing protein [Rubritalea squalenifaciens DSM 18772]
MTNKIRPDVKIPDHEVLRKIGGGSYGEVWLARGVTGAWRAVKIVWREDFEDDRGFEREFEGILKFEPISRDHPGLVNVLHVGRSKEGEDVFYYYVMELGDDIRKGREINPVEYEARTLRSDLVEANGKPLDLEFCLETGIRLSNALVHLHNKGLAHRDVKPSNVIFVGGKAKLADIGLVAARGQRTFVGTEGFVPPEGPGTAQADIYSLGKVLYEMITGKDRMQFPELPDELPGGEKRKQLLAFNQVICEICEPRVSKRNITSAEQLSEALERLQRGKRIRLKRNSWAMKGGLAVLLLSMASVALYYTKPWEVEPKLTDIKRNGQNGGVNPADSVPKAPKYEHCAVVITTKPTGAYVYENGLLLEQQTPTDFRDYKPGTEVTFRFEMSGFKPKTVTYTVPDQDLDEVSEELEKFTPPVADVPWIDPLGVTYLPVDDAHLSGFVKKGKFAQFLKKYPNVKAFEYVPFSQNGEVGEIVLMTREVAENYTHWLEQLSLDNGYLETSQMIIPRQDPDLVVSGFGDVQKKAGLLPTRCEVKMIPYASIRIASDPEGARVYVNGEWRGVAPIPVEKIRPGKVMVEMRMDGYRKHTEVLNLADREERRYTVKLKRNNGVVFGKPWENSLKMKMVPVTDTMMASAWEVRVADYAEFIKSSGHRGGRNPGFEQGPDHPMVGVNRKDAIDFCKWLTEKERKEERISDKHRYKLPSDSEWSLFFGVEEKEGLSPWERNGSARNNPVLADLTLWGGEFPPKALVGNLSDESAAEAEGISKERSIQGYNDGYQNTSPVGKFPPNNLGMYDLCGNAFEWVTDNYKQDDNTGTVRGGSWATYAEHQLLVRWRSAVAPGLRDNQYGFRVVLVDESIKVPASDIPEEE